MPEEPTVEMVALRKDLLIDIDSILSLVAYRYPSRLPAEVAADVKAIAQRVRSITDPR